VDEQAQSPILVVSSRGRHLSPSVGNGYHTLLIKTLSARLYKSGDVFRKALVGQAGCLSHQYGGLESSFMVFSPRIRHPN